MDHLKPLLKRVGIKEPVEDPILAFAHKLEQLNSDRQIKKLAKDFYHAAALSGHPYELHGQVTFLTLAPKAREVFLAGGFNQWQDRSTRMQRVGKSPLFISRQRLPPGAEYKFVVDGEWQTDQANPHTRPDGHGGQNSLVRGSASGSPSGSRLITHPNFYSKHLRNRRPLILYLPPGYDQTTARYPVLYVMDGYENLERGKLPQLFDEELAAGRLPPFIAVFVPHAKRKRGHEYTPYFRGSRLDKFHRFMALEVVPFVDRGFRTLPIAEARTLLGQSFGGTVVTSLAIRAPHLFKHVLAQSGVYGWGHALIPQAYAQTPREDLRLYLDCVANRSEGTQSRLLVRALKQAGYPHYFRTIPSRHEYEDWRVRVPDGLRYLWFNQIPA